MGGRLATRLGGGRLKVKKKVVKKQKEGDAANHQAQHINPTTKENDLVSSEASSSLPSTSTSKQETISNHKKVLTSQGTTTTVRISTSSTVSEVSGK